MYKGLYVFLFLNSNPPPPPPLPHTFRVFRVLKLGGRFGKIQVVGKAMIESIDMLGVLVFLISLSTIIFSTLIYYTEGTRRTRPLFRI